MRPRRLVTRFVHIRVPGVPTEARLAEVRKQYLNGTLNIDRVFICTIDIAVDREFLIGACHSRKEMIAGPDVHDVARQADNAIRRALPNSDPVVLVTSAQYVVSVSQMVSSRRRTRTLVTHTDDREAKERANGRWFDPNMWAAHYHWRPKSWSWPRLAIYDYDGDDGRLVWSWVFHIGPLWLIRQRYAT